MSGLSTIEKGWSGVGIMSLTVYRLYSGGGFGGSRQSGISYKEESSRIKLEVGNRKEVRPEREREMYDISLWKLIRKDRTAFWACMIISMADARCTEF